MENKKLSNLELTAHHAESVDLAEFVEHNSETKKFSDLGLPDELVKSLDLMKFTEPTPIQLEAIPVACEGRDILGSAQTGTGKTGAFSIPLAAWLMKSRESCGLVMTPTRELAVQVMAAIQQIIGRSGAIKTALLIGGEPMPKQFQQLKARPRLIVGTPGRINDHLERGSLILNKADFLVLDEMDRMLDMGFGIQLDRIIKFLPKKRQTLMFSATLPKDIEKLAAQYLTNPVRISVGSTSSPIDNIKQEVIKVAEDEKFDLLVSHLQKCNGSVIVFVKTKRGAEKLCIQLNREDYDAEAIHGDLRQHKRDRVIRSFRANKCNILVATDIAARGLDVPHVQYVINYDIPQCSEDFIHRIGRTGRAGNTGEAFSFVAPADYGKWRDIERLINPEVRLELGSSRNNKSNKRGRGNNRPKSSNDSRKSDFYDKKPSTFKSRDKKPNFEFDDNNGSSNTSRNSQRKDFDFNKESDFGKKKLGFGDKKRSDFDRPRSNRNDPVRNKATDFEGKKFEANDNNESSYSDRPRKNRTDNFEGRRDNRDSRNGSRPDGKKFNERPQRSERSDRFDRSDRPQRSERSDRFDRSDRPQRSERSDRFDRSDRPQRSERSDRFDRSERPQRSERSDRFDRSDRPQRSERSDRFDRSDKPQRSDRSDNKSKGSFGDRPRQRSGENKGKKFFGFGGFSKSKKNA